MSAHRDPDTVADYAKNARMRGLRVIIAGAGPFGRAARRRGRAHGPAGDRRAAHLEDLGGRRPRRPARDRADAARRARGVRGSGQRPRTRPCWRRGSSTRDRALHAPRDGRGVVRAAQARHLAPGGAGGGRRAGRAGRGARRRTPREIRDRASFTVEEVKEREKVTDHDVAAFVDVVAESVGRGRALGAPRAHLLGRARHGARRCSSRRPG